MSKTVTNQERLAVLCAPSKCDDHCTLWRNREACMKAKCKVRNEGRAVESRQKAGGAKC